MKFQDVRILCTNGKTNGKGQMIDKNIGDVSSIYINGMKISEDDKLRFSYKYHKANQPVDKSYK